MVEMTKAIIQKIRSIQGREVSPMYCNEMGMIERDEVLGSQHGLEWMMIDVFIKNFQF